MEDAQATSNVLLLSDEDGTSDDDSHTAIGEGDGKKKKKKSTGVPFAFAQTQDDVLIGEKDNPPPSNRTSTTACSQEMRDITRLLNASNQQNVADGGAADGGVDDDDPVEVALTQSRKHPKIKCLMTQCKEAAFQIFKAVDDCGCTAVVQSSDKADPKGNEWAKLLDVCHGGGAHGRGSMAKFGHQALAKASQMKRKVLDMWKYALDNENEMDPDLYLICKRQYDEHEKAKADEKENTNKQKALAQKDQQDMVQCQQLVGARPDGALVAALPPGHRGQPGMGGGQHSTNLRLGNPATFGVAHPQSNQPETSPLSSAVGNNGGSGGSVTTAPRNVTATPINNNNNNNNGNQLRAPGRHTPTPTDSTNGGTMSLHNSALESVKEASNRFLGLERSLKRGSGTADEYSFSGKKSRKILRLKEKKNMHRENAEFYKAQGKIDKYESAMENYGNACEKLGELLSDSEEE